MGFITKRKAKDGKWRYYIVYRTPQGKRRWEAAGKLRKNADDLLKRREREIANGTYGWEEKEDPLFSEFVSRFLEAKEKSLKPAAYVSYEQIFRLHITPFFGKRRLSKITPLVVQKWVGEMNRKDLSPATVNLAYRYLRVLVKQAQAWGVMDSNPCTAIVLPRIPGKELAFLAPSDISSLLEKAPEPERTLFALLAFSGLRLGEALALQWRNIDFEHSALFVEKTYSYHGGIHDPKTKASRRAVPMFPDLSALLSDYRAALPTWSPDSLLFSKGKGPLDPANLRKVFAKALKDAELPRVTIHSLRHTYASAMLAAGASVKALQRSLGHASATMTLNVYSHMIPENMESSLLKVQALFAGKKAGVLPLKVERQES